MNPFVNPKKRGAALPPGCKDLIDLLEPGKRREPKELAAAIPDVRLSRDDSFSVTLSEIGKSISSALESRATMTVLAIASLDDQLSFDIRYMDGKVWSTSATFISSPSSERKMKAAFERLGLKVPDRYEIPASFFKDQTVYAIYQISPEP